MKDATYNGFMIVNSDGSLHSSSSKIESEKILIYTKTPEGISARNTFSKFNDLQEYTRKTMDWISVHKEEIITAFIAKYGCEPNEIELVEERYQEYVDNYPYVASRWIVRKRKK